MAARRAKHAGSKTKRARRLGLLGVVLVATLLAACTQSGSGAAPSLSDVRRTHYGQLATTDAGYIAAGLQQSVVEFSVEDTPPSVFVNYVVPDAQAAAFESFIDLPPAFSLARVRILESDPAPQYWLSLNVYRVNGITTGMRAEWSTYVDDGTGVPRFMIIRARAADGSIDPIGPLAFPEPFGHVLGNDGVISTAMNKTVIGETEAVVTPDNLFNSTIALPDPGDRNYVVPTSDWVAANDFIYWINGVNDRVFQNATAHSAPLISVDLADVTLDDDTEWVPFIDPSPAHVLVYLDRIEFVISPWWNITEPDGRVDPGTLAFLTDYKKNLYSGQADLQAAQVLAGNGTPTVLSNSEDAPRSVDWHWRVPAGQLAAFESALNLVPTLSLAPVQLVDGEAPDHWLSLNVRRVSGPESGLRAEWTTYVDDGSGVRSLILEARADHPSLDPVNLYTDPYPVTHTDAASVDTTVGSGATAFSSSFVAPAAGPGTTVVASRDWIAAGELTYWGNGIVDRSFHDSTVFQPRISVDPGTVSLTDGSQWAQFVDPTPDRVWVNQHPVGLVTNPWWNL